MNLNGPEDCTTDDLLGGAIKLRQPRRGYRVSMDTILLAAAVPARPGQSVLEIGAGTGGAALALAHRCSGVTVTAIEPQAPLASLARENAEQNGLADRVTILQTAMEEHLETADTCYDHVFANPPYQRIGHGAVSPYPSKAEAHAHQPGALTDWVKAALRFVRHGGTVTFVHRSEALAELVSALSPGGGHVTLCPLWPKQGTAARRFIIQARRGTKGESLLLAGLVLHGQSERYTPAAEAIMRDGQALYMSSKTG